MYRGRARDGETSVLLVVSVSSQAASETLKVLEHELSLADQLDAAWAVRPISLERHDGRAVLLLDDAGANPLCIEELPFELGRFLNVAVNTAAALAGAHAQGLVHKDIRPCNILVDNVGHVRLTGFGRAGPASGPPEGSNVQILSGALPYVAPEQTGRVKLAVDARSDLYSLGIVFYELLTGKLPYVASDPMEWLHSHVARLPIPISQRIENIPPTVEAIVMKLLAKKADERYQTAGGLEADLRRCLDGWTEAGMVEWFDVAAQDTTGRLQMPDRLYGRAEQVDAISASFERVRSGGETEVILVSGPAGVGKSSAVLELRRSHASRTGLFAVGKFDQYTRDIPYATVAQAFRSLVRQVLSSGDADLDRWRCRLVEALGPNGQLMVNLIPELALVIGEQPPAPDLPPQEAKARFHLVFIRLLQVFARPDHPLVLFIDDVQWLEDATIELIERITVDPDVGSLLLICAYRDDELHTGHPFARTRAAMLTGKHNVEELKLAPLTIVDLERLLGDVLDQDPRSLTPLAQLVLEKTEGNPFFVSQFLSTMDEEGLLFFDKTMRVWRWDPGGIMAAHITDNVAELVASRLVRLPRLTLEAIKLLASVGNAASLATLSMISGKSTADVAAVLWEAVQERFLVRVDDTFAFAHDRVQEAVYLLIPEVERPETHLGIGRALLAKMPTARLRERIFEVIDQFGRSLNLLEPGYERENVAALYLQAGVRAKTSAAYPSALRYFGTGLSLLDSSDWERQYSLLFSLEIENAECEFLTGAYDASETRLHALSDIARNPVDGAAVVRLQTSLYVALGNQAKAVEVALAYLRDFGIDWTPHPTEDDLRAEIETMKDLLRGRPVEQLVDLPTMTDPDWLATMDVLAYLIFPAVLTDSNLEALVYTQMVNLSLQHGNCDASCYAYASFMVAVGLRFGDYQLGGRFGDLGLKLVDDYGLDRFKARTYTCCSAYVIPWTKHLPTSLDITRIAMDVGIAAGDLVYAAATAKLLVSNLLVSGTELKDVQHQAEQSLALSRKAGFGLAADAAIGQLLLVRELRGVGTSAAAGSETLPDKNTFRLRLEEAGAPLLLPLVWHRIHQMQWLYHAQNYEEAFETERQARRDILVTRAFIDLAEYHFYAALIRARIFDVATSEDRSVHMGAVREHLDQIATWERSCPENFGTRRALVAAEIARMEDKQIEALVLYEEAISTAKKYGFLQNEALSNELAGRFCAACGLTSSAKAFLRSARSCYSAWGASAKVRQMDLTQPGLDGDKKSFEAAAGELQHLDLAAVVDMSQAVSGEIVLDRLIERLMVTVVEHSGAVRGLLLLPQEGEMRVVAEAVTDEQGVSVKLGQFARRLPETILSYVTHTREDVILDDAQEAELFSSDPYIMEARSSSILCLPLVKQKELVGLLYLENGLSSHLFTKRQVTILRLLASQAAISLENAALYRDARQAQDHARRVAEELRVSYDMIPAQAWNTRPDGLFPVFNKQWHDYTGVSPDAAREGGWVETYHPEDREKVVRKWTELVATGTAGQIEARILRHDGVARTFLVKGTPMRDETGAIIKWFGTHTDIDDLKRVEEAQELLARAGRLTALGELTASIAHEVNQPLMAIVTNAATCLRWLSDDQLDVVEAREAAERIIRDGHRAGDVITSIRALAKKSPLTMAKVEVNSMVDDVLALTRGELQRHGIALTTTLEPNVGSAFCDRIQLQQVVLNLILNAVEAISLANSETRQVTVGSERVGQDTIMVSIADTGPGIDLSKSDQIFDAFFTTKKSGLGMGLSICRSIVEAHGGRLWAAPNQPIGSVFSFTLGTARNLSAED
ncbi:AAA family ATPase [Rhizobium ruizarguesonis]|uniref:AAA family ATPase n=1 Tax=Rhizobium ruizarguesonis TaxID=2081791 RepID=UPI001FDEBD96|nr:AAA family ATPase [Rhizobium ruizarguesonis]